MDYKRVAALSYAAAACTAIAGVLHLLLAPGSFGFNFNNGIFFTVAGIIQIFWALPISRRWAIAWHYVGIAGTAVLIAMWVVTRMPENPITGRAGPVNAMAIAIEVFQVAFIALTAAIIAYNRRRKRLDTKTAEDAA